MKEKIVNMKVTYDKDSNAAYIYIKDEISEGEVKKSLPVDDNIILDFDSGDQLIGIEVLSADKVMPKDLISGLLS